MPGIFSHVDDTNLGRFAHWPLSFTGVPFDTFGQSSDEVGKIITRGYQ